VRRSPERAVRAAAARAFSDALARHEATFGLLFSRRIEGDLAIAQARGFRDSTSAALTINEGSPDGVIAPILASVQHNRPLVRRYARAIARAFGTSQASYADVLARSPWPFRSTYTVDQAIDMIVAAHAPLGMSYQRDLRARFALPWLHLPPMPNKSGLTAFFVPVGGGHPHGIMTYTGDLNSVRNLGRISESIMMDGDIPADSWPDRRADDQPAYGNARWLLGQFFVDDYLAVHAQSHRERAAVLLDHLSMLWTEFFYRAAMVELEQWVMERIQTGTPPTGAEISAHYLEIMRAYNAHGDGGIVVDDVYAREWATESILFLTHHQASWAISHATSAAMAEGIARRDPRVMGMMRDSRGHELEYANDFLLAMGVDATTSGPYDAMARRMNAMLDLLERELSALDL
jgi:oligoendopeptidase F